MKFRKSETYIDAKQNGRPQKTAFKTFIFMKKKRDELPNLFGQGNLSRFEINWYFSQQADT